MDKKFRKAIGRFHQFGQRYVIMQQAQYLYLQFFETIISREVIWLAYCVRNAMARRIDPAKQSQPLGLFIKQNACRMLYRVLPAVSVQQP